MKRFILIAVMLFVFSGIATAQTTPKQKVAVYVTGEAETGYKKVIGSKLVSSITRSQSFAAVERTADFLAAISSEQDYQMSGAVSDNQIVRLGQQFGVRYVLVADVSEVFESMFISARMIDVQTGQITNSAEASAAVSSMDGLTRLSEDVISGLIDGSVRYNNGSTGNRNGIDISNVKIIGPFSYTDLNTFSQKIPVGYRVASKAEVESLIISYRNAHKTLPFPIYAGMSIVDISSSDFREYLITAWFYENENVAAIELNNYNYYRNNYSGSWSRIDAIKSGYVYLMPN